MPCLPPEKLGGSAWQYTARLRAMPHMGHLAVMHQCIHCWEVFNAHWPRANFAAAINCFSNGVVSLLKFVPKEFDCCVFAINVSPLMKAHTCELLKASGRWLYCQEKEVRLQATLRGEMKWGPALQPTGGKGLWRAVTGGAVLWTRGITFIEDVQGLLCTSVVCSWGQ